MYEPPEELLEFNGGKLTELKARKEQPVDFDTLREALLCGIDNYIPEWSSNIYNWTDVLFQFMAEYLGAFWGTFIAEDKKEFHRSLVQNASPDGLLIFLRGVLGTNNRHFIVPLIKAIKNAELFDFTEGVEQLEKRISDLILQRLSGGLVEKDKVSNKFFANGMNSNNNEGSDKEEITVFARSSELKRRQREAALEIKKDNVLCAASCIRDLVNGDSKAGVTREECVVLLAGFDISSVAKDSFYDENNEVFKIVTKYQNKLLYDSNTELLGIREVLK